MTTHTSKSRGALQPAAFGRETYEEKRKARADRDAAYKRSLASRKGRNRAHRAEWRAAKEHIAALVRAAESDPRFVRDGLLTIRHEPQYKIAELEAKLVRLRFELEVLPTIARALGMPYRERRARAAALQWEKDKAERSIRVWSAPYFQRKFDDFVGKPFDLATVVTWERLTRLEFEKRYFPERERERKRDRRLKERMTRAGKIDRQAIYERDGGICQICGDHVSSDDFTLDHIVPLSAGGPHTETNLRIAHRSCNSRLGLWQGYDATQRRSAEAAAALKKKINRSPTRR